MKRNNIYFALLYAIAFGVFATIMMTFPALMAPIVALVIAFIIYKN